MRIRSCWALVLILVSLTLPAFPKLSPEIRFGRFWPSGVLGSVVDTPLDFKLFAVRLPAMGRVAYSGPNSMIYGLSGTLAIALDGTTHTISEGVGAFIPAGRAAGFSVPGAEPASF